MTQSRLADACGLSVRTIRRAELGLPLSDETVLALCAVFGCTASDLVAPPVADLPSQAREDASRLVGATVFGLFVAALVYIASFEIVFTLFQHPGDGSSGTDPQRTWLVRAMLGIMAVNAAGLCAHLPAMLAGVSPSVRAWLEDLWWPGPYSRALCSGVSFASMGMMTASMAARHPIAWSTVPVLISVLAPVYMVIVCVLGPESSGSLVRKGFRICGPVQVALAVLVQVVGLATGNPAAGGWGPMLLLPLVLDRTCTDRARSEWATLAAVVILSLPVVSQPFVEALVAPGDATTSTVVMVASLLADLFVVGLLIRLHPGSDAGDGQVVHVT